MTVADIDALAREYAASAGDGAPAYERIKLVLGNRIRSGAWAEGDRLPSEHQLVAALGVSRMTINRALRELSDSGAIMRTAGVGSFVAPTKAASSLLEVRNIADEVQLRGHRHSTRLVWLAEEAVDSRPFAADSTTDRAFRSVIVHHEDEVPIQLEDRLVNPAIVPAYLKQDFTAATPNDYLSRVAPLTRTELVIEAVLPTVEQAELLGIEPTAPCLQILRRTWSAEGLVSIVRLTQPGARSRLEGGFETAAAR